IRKVFIDKALEHGDCGLTYDDDFAPWLGTRLGVGVLPPENEGEDPVTIMALQVSDVDAAKKTITAAEKCGHDKLNQALNCAGSGSTGDFTSRDDTGSDVGLASVGDYLIVADTQEQADRYAQAADASSLADDAQFKADMDSLGDVGVA